MPRFNSPNSWDNTTNWGALTEEEIHDLISIMDDLLFTEEEKIKIITLLQEKYKDDKFMLNLLSNEKFFFELLDKVLFKLKYFWWVKDKRQCFNILEWLQETEYKKLKEQLFWDYKYEIENRDKNIKAIEERLEIQKNLKERLLSILDGVELTEEEKNISPHEEMSKVIREWIKGIEEN